MELAHIDIEDVTPTLISRQPIPKGIIGGTISFSFNSYWDTLDKTVVFKSRYITKDVPYSEIIKIPQEVVEKDDTDLLVGVCGVDLAKKILTPTLWINLGPVYDATDPCGDTTTDPTLPFWAHIKQQIGNLFHLKTKAKDNLVEAINEVYDMAEEGSGGINFTVGHGLKMETIDNNNILSVNVVNDAEKDNTLPITSAAVYTEIGNIDALLETI